MPYRYPNKKLAFRGPGGRFRKAQASDIGIMGTCPKCGHFLVRFYDGDKSDQFIDPRKLRNRCYTCEPPTESERAAIEEETRKARSKFADFFEWASKDGEV